MCSLVGVVTERRIVLRLFTRLAVSLPLACCKALSLSERADERAARAELRFPQAEQAVHHVETTRSTFIQARRNSSFMHARAEHLERQAEAVAKVSSAPGSPLLPLRVLCMYGLPVMQGAEALMQRASEKATEALEVKRRAQGAAVSLV